MTREVVKKDKKQEQESAGKSANILLWILSILAVIAAAVGNLYFATSLSLVIRVVLVVALVVIALVLAGFTSQGKAFIGFFRESRIELRRIIWPTRSETVQTTFIVMGVTVITSLILWGFDSIIVSIINFITQLRF